MPTPPALQRPLARLLCESVLGLEGPLGEDVVALHGEDVVAAGLEHRVTPAMERRLRSAPDAPERLQRILKLHRHAQLMRHMQASGDLRVVAELLDGAGLGWIVAKGPVAADLIWPHPDMREYYDVDVFVSRRDFAEALRLLQDAGFTLVDRNWPELLRTMRAEVALRGQAGTHLDLHWDIAVPPSLRRAFRTDMPGMLSRADRRSLGSGVTVGVFDPVDTVLHLLFHAAQAGANKLMWIADIHHACVAEGFDWAELERRCRRARIEVPAALVLERVQRTLGLTVEPPPSVFAPASGPWGRLARWREARAPFPGLPGDVSLSGIVFSSARPGPVTSVVEAARATYETRRVERLIAKNGPQDRVLYRDVPDPRARERYLDAVTGGAL